MKRFTETDKWKDKWFRKLRPEFKLVWAWLLDNCDAAGSIEQDEELIEFQIGCDVDWQAFMEAMEGRLQTLECGRLWIVKFIEFQYVQLRASNKAHIPAFKAIKKYQIPYVEGPGEDPKEDHASGTLGPGQDHAGTTLGAERVEATSVLGTSLPFEKVPVGSLRASQEKDKDKDKDKEEEKDKDKDKDKGSAGPSKFGPPGAPQLAEVREYFERIGHADAADEFFDHYTANGWVQNGTKRIKDWQAAARNWKRRRSQFPPAGGSRSLDEGVLT